MQCSCQCFTKLTVLESSKQMLSAIPDNVYVCAKGGVNVRVAVLIVWSFLYPCLLCERFSSKQMFYTVCVCTS